MKYSTHKFHCDLWHVFLTVSPILFTLQHFDSILFRWLCTNRAKCALEHRQTFGGGNSITEYCLVCFDFIWFSFSFALHHNRECMVHWLRLIERKLSIIPFYMEWSWCSTWMIIIFAVCLWQNTWLHESNEYWTHTNQLRLTQTQTYAHEFTQCNWNARVYTVHVHKSLDDDLHQKWSEHKTIFE